MRELRTNIQEAEKDIREWHTKQDEAVRQSRAAEIEIKARYQVKINGLLREEQAASRRGAVRQKCLIDAPNVYSMTLERDQPSGTRKNSKKYF